MTVENVAARTNLRVDDVRALSLSLLEGALRQFSMFSDLGALLTRRQPPSLLRYQTEDKKADSLRQLARQISEDRPLDAVKLKLVGGLIQQVQDSGSLADAIASYGAVRQFTTGLMPPQGAQNNQPAFTQSNQKEHLVLHAAGGANLQAELGAALAASLEEQRFVAAVMQMCRDHRRNKLPFSGNEDLALQAAYRMLDHGARLPLFFKALEHTEKRHPAQTFVSFADPGDGHLAVTVRDSELLDGLIVHVEYIDRDGEANRALVEAYRLPAIRNAARVRLHVGDETPCTVFIGRPVFEGGDFRQGLLKAAHTTASVCSAMFAHGIADCKVAMDNRTAGQAIELMEIIAGNVVRDPIRQSLSAAFNIMAPLTDDTEPGKQREIGEPYARAERAIGLALAGGFNKIAWDGADDGPSVPILLGRFTRVQMLKLVHAAHEKGLETYISAGMKPKHLRDAVLAGVGGVGIGTKLHHSEVRDGIELVGEIDPQKVKDTLAIQKNAANSAPGKAARKLALMDWQNATGVLHNDLNKLRHDLFDLLYAYLGKLDDYFSEEPSLSEAERKAKLSEERHYTLHAKEKEIEDFLNGLSDAEDKLAKSQLTAAEEYKGPVFYRSGGFGRDDGGLPAERADQDVTPQELGPSGLWARQVLAVYDSGGSDLELTTVDSLRGYLKNEDVVGLQRLYQGGLRRKERADAAG